MGYKATVRAMEAAQRRQQSDSQHRLRELERQAKEQAKLSVIEQARLEVETFDGQLEVLVSVHKEQGDASVPFEFDVHALIESENAPVLEHRLHKQFLEMQINKMNYRKEFFRVNLTDIHQAVEKLKQGEDFTVKVWTDKAVATEYKDSLEIENDPEKKAKWLARQKALADRQIKLDTLRFSVPDAPEPVADDDGA